MRQEASTSSGGADQATILSAVTIPRLIVSPHGNTDTTPISAVVQPVAVLDLAVGVVAAVEAHEQPLGVDLGDDGHRAPPHLLLIGEGILGIVDAQIDAVVAVRQQELAAILEVAVDHLDDGLAEGVEL